MTLTNLKNTEASTGWKPTAYLKWNDLTPERPIGRKTLVLQQLWINSDGRDEWRDVPFGE